MGTSPQLVWRTESTLEGKWHCIWRQGNARNKCHLLILKHTYGQLQIEIQMKRETSKPYKLWNQMLQVFKVINFGVHFRYTETEALRGSIESKWMCRSIKDNAKEKVSEKYITKTLNVIYSISFSNKYCYFRHHQFLPQVIVLWRGEKQISSYENPKDCFATLGICYISLFTYSIFLFFFSFSFSFKLLILKREITVK